MAEYLAAKPEDSYAEGRFKNALEGAGLDVALAGVFALGLKAVKYARSGNQEAAKAVVSEMAQPQVVETVNAAETPQVLPAEATQVASKPRVRVKATSEVVGEKPRVRVKANSQVVAEPPVPEGMVRVYHSGAKATADETGRWVSTNKTYASDYREGVPLNYIDLPEADPRLQGAYPEQGVKQGFTFNFELTPEESTASEAAAATTLALARNFSDRSFLLNANQLIRALSEPEANAEGFLGNMAAATIPASSALRGYANSDPYLREARGIVDRALKDIPGFSDNLPPRRDVFGEPLLRRIGLTTNYDPDVVEAEYNRMILETGEGVSVPGPNHNDVDLRDVTLSDGQNAYDVYQQFAANPFPGAGLSLKDALRRLITSDLYQLMPDGDAGVRGTRLNAFAGVIQDYRAAAYKRLLHDYPEVGRLTRRKQAQAASQLKENITGIPGTASELMKALGYD